MEKTTVLTYELRVDCYAGDACDELRPYWNCYADGDMQDDDLSEDVITIDLKDHPPGTVVVVKEPVCPECEYTKMDCDCGFDWEVWVLEEYS